jgi:hypothetical protein
MELTSSVDECSSTGVAVTNHVIKRSVVVLLTYCLSLRECKTFSETSTAWDGAIPLRCFKILGPGTCVPNRFLEIMGPGTLRCFLRGPRNAVPMRPRLL